LHPHAQLLPQFPGESGALALLRFHLAARELPQVGSLADRLAARHQHLIAALDQRRHDEDPPFHGRSPRPNRTPALETMKAPPGTTRGPPEKPEPGSNAPRERPVVASTARSGPCSIPTRTRPPAAPAAVAYLSFPSASFQVTMPLLRVSAVRVPRPLA